MWLLPHQPVVVLLVAVPMVVASVHDQDQRLAFSNNNSNSTHRRAQVYPGKGKEQRRFGKTYRPQLV